MVFFFRIMSTAAATKQKSRREILITSNWSTELTEEEDTPPTPVLLPPLCNPPLPETFVIDHLFSNEECLRLIEMSELHGYGHTDYPQEYRGNLRLITTDMGLATKVWERLKPFVPFEITNDDGTKWRAVGLNERWRLAKYFPGDRFQRHCDASFQKSPTIESMFTVNIYMNAAFEGGNTRFYYSSFKKRKDLNDEEQKKRETIQCEVVPEAGRCLIFRQPPGRCLLHDGEEVKSGVKYLFRSDVMYEQMNEQMNEPIKNEYETREDRTGETKEGTKEEMKEETTKKETAADV